MTVKLVVDIVGWIGAILILLAYVAVSTKKVAGDSYAYQTGNLLGSICLILNTVFYGAFPSSGVNVVWAGIAIFIIIKRKKMILKTESVKKG